jgi:hypothetical protein
MRVSRIPLRVRARRGRRFADRRWLDHARRAIDAAGLRADAARNAAHLAELIAAHADGRTLRARPTMGRLVDLSGLSRRTCQTWCRFLERAGFLAVLEHGVTPRFAPDRLSGEDGNLAREWALTLPGRALSCAPSLPPTASKPFAGAREAEPGGSDGQGQGDRRSAPGSPAIGPPHRPGQAREWPLGTTPQRRADRLTAVQALQRGHMVLARLSSRRLRSIARPWFAAGWTPADLLYALDWAPDGQPHRFAGRVRDPAGWLGHRLGFWLDSSGQPGPPRSAGLAASAAVHRAELGRAATGRAAARATRSADYAARAAEARAGLLAALRQAGQHTATVHP